MEYYLRIESDVIEAASKRLHCLSAKEFKTVLPKAIMGALIHYAECYRPEIQEGFVEEAEKGLEELKKIYKTTKEKMRKEKARLKALQDEDEDEDET